MSESGTLPTTWRRVTLGDIIDYGKADKIEPNEIPPDAWVLELEDIEKDTSALLQRLTFDQRRSKSTKNKFSKGDVLYGKLRPYLNKVLIADQDGYCTTEIIPLKPNEVIDNRYLYYWLKHPDFLDYVNSVSHGLSMPRLGTEAGSKAPLILAPLNEQKRIADKLDSLMARVTSCRKRLERVPSIIERFRRAVLTTAFNGNLTSNWRSHNPDSESGGILLNRIRAQHREWWEQRQIEAMQNAGRQPKNDNWKHNYKEPERADVNEVEQLPDSWAWASGAEIVEPGAEIVYGIVQPGPKLDDGVPYVRGVDIEDGQILLDQLAKTSHEIANRYSRSSLSGGDVLLGIIRATKVAIVPNELTGGNITQGTARFRPSSVIRTDYLAKALEAPFTQAWLHSHYRGIDMPGLNLADVRRVPIPLTPLSEQDEIIRRINILFDLADRLDARYKAALARVEHLTSAILSKAFRGELVPQDSTDKPASVLLEQISSMRAARSAKPKRVMKGRKPRMTKITKESVREVITKLPQNTFSFNELRKSFPGDYDSLRDVVFALLDEAESILTQVFDLEAREMRFVRRNK